MRPLLKTAGLSGLLVLVLLCSGTQGQEVVAETAEEAAADAKPEAAEGACGQDQRIELIRCFIYLLDDWAWNLWEIKKNLASLNCTVHKQMDSCMETTGCTITDAVEVSTALTELLTYRRDAGTFLHSFLALSFACHADGQKIIMDHMECLQKYHEGMHVLNEIDELQDRFKELKESSDSEGACALLKERGDHLKQNAVDECGSEQVGRLICKSVTSPFSRIDKEFLGSCVDTLCPEPATPAPAEDDPAEVANAGVSGAESKTAEQNGKGASAVWASLFTTLISIIITYCARGN